MSTTPPRARPPVRQGCGVTRADVLRLSSAAGLSGLLGQVVHAQTTDAKMQTRPIPVSGEALPVVGCGTWQTFDVGTAPAVRAPLTQVLSTLFDQGGSVIDSSPMYGASEGVVGDLLADAGTRSKAFLATKVWTQGREAGAAQIRRSMELLRTDKLDLLQVHNLLDWRTQLITVRSLKEQGHVRYLGVTHYTSSAYAELEAVMRSEKLDFVQVNYSADDRAAETRILPFAQERGVAVLINMPFGGGGLLRGLRKKALPGWAGELGCSSWPQLLLKFVLSHPAVTCVIPGTSNPAHMRDNAAAGSGIIPDEATRRRIVAALND
jgi:diketogulonate reductase-like aldo/keto reductase